MLVNNLLGIPTALPVSTTPLSTLVLPVVDEGEDVEVVVTKNMKRADIEEEVPDVFSDEEEDFDFEEEESHYSGNQEEDD